MAFRISKSCYRYERKRDDESDEMATWLIRLTENHRNWGFGLCYLYLRNVKEFKWNYNPIEFTRSWTSIYGSNLANVWCEKPEVLTVPQAINRVWTMDFMHDQLPNDRIFRLLNVIDDYKC